MSTDFPIRKILCPVDFSEVSDVAVRKARALADTLGARLTLLHVVEPAYEFEVVAGGQPPSQLVEEYEHVMRDRLSKLASELGVVDAPRVEHGVPFAVIAELAEREGFDLIVLGTHGRGGLRHMLVGSVAERVVRTSHVPVLTLR